MEELSVPSAAGKAGDGRRSGAWPECLIYVTDTVKMGYFIVIAFAG